MYPLTKTIIIKIIKLGQQIGKKGGKKEDVRTKQWNRDLTWSKTRGRLLSFDGISLKCLWRYWKSFLVLDAHLALEAVFLPLLKAPVASTRSWRQLESTGRGHLNISWKEVHIRMRTSV